MKITDAFLGEHGVFYAQLDHAEDLLARQPTAAQVQSMSAVIAAALVQHAQLENDLLFAAMENELGAGGPTPEMRNEHDRIERLLEAVATASSVASATELLRDAIAEARDHFRKEEQVAFPLAEQVLGSDRLSELGRSWAERRGVSVDSAASTSPWHHGFVGGG
jgi:iron-sulfur cluster repair protein YtfE (RIC family)